MGMTCMHDRCGRKRDEQPTGGMRTLLARGLIGRTWLTDRLRCVALLAIVLAASGTDGRGEPFRLLAWNVESNRPGSPPVSDPAVIASRLENLAAGADTRAAIFVLSEVDPRTAPSYCAAIESSSGVDYEPLLSASGGFRDADSLLVLVDVGRFSVEDTCEIHRYGGISGNTIVADASEDVGTLRARSPLAIRLVDRTTGASMWVVAVHLARGEEQLRTDQARMLCRWATDRGDPIILAGDCNFDFDIRTRRGNQAWDVIDASGVWKWLEPDPLIDTNWADDRTAPRGVRRDRYPDSMLDFVFVANSARAWIADSDVVVVDGDFPDDDTTSDHRPVIATFDPVP